MNPPPYPPNTEFQHQDWHYLIPVEVIRWQKSITFGRWSALVRFDDGLEIWTYPRLDAELEAEHERKETESAKHQMLLILSRFVQDDFKKSWPGCEFGKATIGNAFVDGAKRFGASAEELADAFDGNEAARLRQAIRSQGHRIPRAIQNDSEALSDFYWKILK